MKISLSKSNKERLFVSLVYCGLIYSIYLCFVNNSWWPLIVSFLLYNWHSMLGNNCAMHRMYSHKSYTTGPIRNLWLLAEAMLCGGGIGPITYAAVHRAHHAYSDTDKDPHSPYANNPLYIALGFHIFRRDNSRRNSGIRLPKDLMRDPLLKFVELHYHSIWLFGSLIVWTLFGFNVLLYGFIVPGGMYIIFSNTIGNVLTHSNTIKRYIPTVYRNFETNDQSVNSPITQILLKGEGLHNNHHFNQTALNQAFKKGEFDPTWFILKWIFLDKETIAKHEKNL